MYSSIFLGLAVAIAAPGVKDKPKKEPTVVGEWIAEKMIIAGMEIPRKDDDPLRFKFAAEGKVTINDGNRKTEHGTYKLDAKKKPAEIDLLPAADSKDPILHGIFKIEGETLTICLSEKKSPRPTKFASAEDAGLVMVIFKRVKK